LLTLVLGSFDPTLQLAFDFRHESWDGIETQLPSNAVRVNQLDAGAPFRYVRFRDPPYDDAAIGEWGARLRPLVAEGVRLYCYFRHEDEPTAPEYADKLLDTLRG
jgi:uncharacterized protein YecE (DUF72 family)